MAKFEIARSFDHKQHGRIGIVNLTADVKAVTIDGKELPPASVEYLLTFALQNLQDAYAGADSADDAKARFEKKLARLIEGTIGVRTGGSGASPEEKMRRNVMAELLRKSDAGKEALKAHEDDRDEFLDAAFAKQPQAKQDAIMGLVAQRIEEARKRAEQAKALAGGIEL